MNPITTETPYTIAVRIGQQHKDEDVRFMVEQANSFFLKDNDAEHKKWKNAVIEHVKKTYPNDWYRL